MADQKKLMERLKVKTDNEKLSINSQLYFIADAAVLSVADFIRKKSTVIMAWLEGEKLVTKTLYEPEKIVNINKVIVKREKEAMLIMISDEAIIVISSKDPKGCTPQVIRPQQKQE